MSGSRCLSLAVALLALSGLLHSSCKPRQTAGLKDFSLEKDEFVATVNDGVIFLDLWRIETVGNPALTGKTWEQRLADLQKDLTRDLELGKAGQPNRPRGIEFTIKEGIQRQILFLMRTIDESIVINQANAKLITASIPQDQQGLIVPPPINEPGSGSGAVTGENPTVTPTNTTAPVEIYLVPTAPKEERLVEIRYSISMKVMVNKNKASSFRDTTGLVPTSNNFTIQDNSIQIFKPCIEHSNLAEVDIHNLFYYLKPSKCEFDKLNEDGKYFRKVALQLRPSGTASSGGSPEYNRVWEDGRLVATFVFGKYNAPYEDAAGPALTADIDPGTTAYHDFVERLKKMTEMKLLKEDKVSAENQKFMFQMTDRANKKYLIDIQAVHVDDIGSLTTSLSKLVFGDRIGPSDLFVYNGHSGYGNNIDHIQKLIKPKDNQYVLFYLNGCNTYTYADIDNPNFDVISNANQTYFTDMTNASLAVLSGMIRGQNFKQILPKIPQAACPIVSGEKDSSGKKK